MRFLITAGPTREPIDEVRYIGNRSSGRMGTAIAQTAVEAGHDVTLLLGPAPVLATLGDRIAIHRFETCAELEALLDEHFEAADVLVMAAAVADFRPAERRAGKLERTDGANLHLQLEPTPDLVARAAKRKRPDQRVVAFALEQQDRLEQRAADKLRGKAVDAIVANPLGTMDADAVAAVWMDAAGGRERIGPLSKPRFAERLVRLIERLAPGTPEA